MSEEVRVVSMKLEHAVDVAKLHIEGIHKGFLSSLGVDFVTSLYKAIAQSKDSFGYVAVKEGKVVGFASFTTNLNQLYKSVVSKNGLRFFFLLSCRMFSWSAIRKIFETLFYPSRIKKINLPKAEFLSMVISPDARGHGLATRFVKTGFEECMRRGVRELKILAAEEIIPINKMYEKFGFQIATKIENHGVVSNVYVVSTDFFKEIPSH
jgi:GNAT superfamily N-acetyltransferase